MFGDAFFQDSGGSEDASGIVSPSSSSFSSESKDMKSEAKSETMADEGPKPTKPSSIGSTGLTLDDELEIDLPETGAAPNSTAENPSPETLVMEKTSSQVSKASKASQAVENHRKNLFDALFGSDDEDDLPPPPSMESNQTVQRSSSERPPPKMSLSELGSLLSDI